MIFFKHGLNETLPMSTRKMFLPLEVRKLMAFFGSTIRTLKIFVDYIWASTRAYLSTGVCEQ